MKKIDLFDKPMNGLYSRSVKGGMKTLLLICLSIFGSYLIYINSENKDVKYTIGEVKTVKNVFPMNIDIVIYDRTCDTLSYHFDSPNSSAPSTIRIDKTPYFPTKGPFSQKESCRIHGYADIYPGDGDCHITTNDKEYSVNGQHRHLTKINRQDSFYYHINDLYFGSDFDSSAHTLKDHHNRNEIEAASHTTYDLKVFPVVQKGVENGFMYAASQFTLQKDGFASSKAYTGLYLKYALQPNAMNAGSFHSTQKERVVLALCSFGSIYSLLSFLCNLFYKSKIISKRD